MVRDGASSDAAPHHEGLSLATNDDLIPRRREAPSRGMEMRSGWPHSYPGNVPKRDKTLTFSATIRVDFDHMNTITVITILALLTISGAVITDRILTGQDQQVAVSF